MNPNTPALNFLYKEFGSADPRAVKDSKNLLLTAIEKNVSHKLLLKKSDWAYLLESSNLAFKNLNGYQASDLALAYNSENELYFDDNEWDILMPSIDPKHVCAQGFTPLTALLSTYTSQCHNIGQNHIKYLMGISDFKRGGHQNMTPLDYALIYNDKTDWLSYENWETLYTKCEFDLKKISLNLPQPEVNAILFRKETFQIQREQRLLLVQLVKARVPETDSIFSVGGPGLGVARLPQVGQFQL